jgi:hypothetical protein
MMYMPRLFPVFLHLCNKRLSIRHRFRVFGSGASSMGSDCERGSMKRRHSSLSDYFYGGHLYEKKRMLEIEGDVSPEKIGDLSYSAFITRNLLELSFDQDERGKRVYFAARRESGTVKKCSWSDIFNAVIPMEDC